MTTIAIYLYEYVWKFMLLFSLQNNLFLISQLISLYEYMHLSWWHIFKDNEKFKKNMADFTLSLKL